MATDYSYYLDKIAKIEKGLSNMWFYAFMKHWPDLMLVKPQKLQMSRAKGASRETINDYFMELGVVFREHDQMNTPERLQHR